MACQTLRRSQTSCMGLECQDHQPPASLHRMPEHVERVELSCTASCRTRACSARACPRQGACVTYSHLIKQNVTKTSFWEERAFVHSIEHLSLTRKSLYRRFLIMVICIYTYWSHQNITSLCARARGCKDPCMDPVKMFSASKAQVPWSPYRPQTHADSITKENRNKQK